jgi:hypothetical protein
MRSQRTCGATSGGGRWSRKSQQLNGWVRVLRPATGVPRHDSPVSPECGVVTTLANGRHAAGQAAAPGHLGVAVTTMAVQH